MTEDWERIKLSRGGSAQDFGVRLTVYDRGGRLTVSGKLARELGWSVAQRAAVDIGRGKMTGKLRVSVGPEGYAFHKHSRTASGNLGFQFRVPQGVDLPPAKSAKCHYTVENHNLIVDLPEPDSSAQK